MQKEATNRDWERMESGINGASSDYFLLGWINKSYLVILSYTKDCAIGDGEYGE